MSSVRSCNGACVDSRRVFCAKHEGQQWGWGSCVFVHSYLHVSFYGLSVKGLLGGQLYWPGKYRSQSIQKEREWESRLAKEE